jgi:hypothetical protein
VGHPRRYLPQMTHDHRNTGKTGGTKRDKSAIYPLRESLGLTPGNLSRHLTVLATA